MEFDEHEEQEDMSSIQLPPVRKLTGGSGYRYRECLKNHAVSIGGHAVDGCGEFMASGDDSTLDALMCAACSCHRNFHRKESTFSHSAQYLLPAPPGYYHNHRPSGYLNMTSAPTSFRPLPLALPSASREDLDEISNPSSSGGGGNGNGNGSGSSRKRFRTKFTSDQKDRMLAFAETLGWRIQKQDEGAVQQFCTETGVKRHVLKVWMHNNKHTIGKKP